MNTSVRKRLGSTGEVKEMNFEQWIKEMSKGSLFSTDEDNKTFLDKINEVKYWDVEDEEEFQRFKLEKS
jgi:hypothetical protein